MKLAISALAVLAALAATPAAADGPDPAYGAPRAPAYGAPYRHRHDGWHRPRRYRGYGYSVRSYGAPPAYGVLTGPSEYTEEYIGRGLIYNTPPAPIRSRAYGAISVRG